MGAAADDGADAVRARLLGSAAGGGVPQWNCACEKCVRARRVGPHRSQDCLVVTGTGERWWLVNASPDIRVQVIAAPELVPGPGRRETPLAGVLLTDAELDHALGLLVLREGSPLAIHATAPVRDALETAFPLRQVLDPYGTTSWHTVQPGKPLRLDERLSATAIPLGSKRPRYAAACPPGPEWVVAYRFEDEVSGGALVYAPCLAAWTEEFDAALAGARWLVVDGTFYREDEMVRATGGGGTASSMGHLPIESSLPRVGGHPGLEVVYTHLNNTNPVLDPASAEYAAVVAGGGRVGSDGLVMEV